jgi:hypothetical protein
MHYLIMLLFGALSRFLPWVVAKGLTALGLGVFTLAALTTLFSQAKGYLTHHMSYIPVDVYMLMDTSGILSALSMLLAAMATRIGWLATQTAVRKI